MQLNSMARFRYEDNHPHWNQNRPIQYLQKYVLLFLIVCLVHSMIKVSFDVLSMHSNIQTVSKTSSMEVGFLILFLQHRQFHPFDKNVQFPYIARILWHTVIKCFSKNLPSLFYILILDKYNVLKHIIWHI